MGLTHPGSTITCRPRGRNAARFDCAVIYGAESQCVTVSVSPLGNVSAGRLMPSRCTAPELKARLPRPTPQLVSADVTRIVGGARFLCARAGAGNGRFACARVTAAGVDCRIARVVAWSPLHPRPGGAECRQVRTLRQTVLG